MYISFIGLISARRDIQSSFHSPRSNISINISSDTLILNKWKESQDKLIYKYTMIQYIHNIHTRSIEKN